MKFKFKALIVSVLAFILYLGFMNLAWYKDYMERTPEITTYMGYDKQWESSGKYDKITHNVGVFRTESGEMLSLNITSGFALTVPIGAKYTVYRSEGERNPIAYKLVICNFVPLILLCISAISVIIFISEISSETSFKRFL